MNSKIDLLKKTVESIRRDGLKTTEKRIASYLNTEKVKQHEEANEIEFYTDVLFINGCDPQIAPHPPRYRITHQREQLEACGLSTNEVYYTQLQVKHVRMARVFVIFRCPFTPTIGEFIEEAKRLHKTVLYDIDDLVIDTVYTDTIPYVMSLSREEKAVYDDGVIRMGKTLSLCDAAITTTERLAEELRKYVPEVFINRNTASDKMYKLSEEALERRDNCRSLSNNSSTARKVAIGYFSGSITHNADFELIQPAIVRLLRENPNVELHVVGELDLPQPLKPLKNQIVRSEFVNWEKLPELIASVDINLAPLEISIFNEAKSENKWVEAALVKVPTVASNFGAFKRMINNGETGILCDSVDDWYVALKKLSSDETERSRLAENAYRFCKEHCLTLYSGFALSKYIKSKMKPNAVFLLPSLNISGGIIVALKHASFLYEKGYDVSLAVDFSPMKWMDFEVYKFSVLSGNTSNIKMHIDKAIATMWTTVDLLESYHPISERYYLVQNYETDFYKADIHLRIQANRTYCTDAEIHFITISRWCQNWLKEKYEKESLYAPNGIKSESFLPHKRDLSGKVRILIEGDCGSYYKNVDESFRIVDALDPERFEVWYMSYQAEPKPNYRVDRFLHRVPHEKVFEVYRQCDILIKSSILESFSYPPLEMMASGGYCVVAPNAGNAEYLVDGENCLLYELGDIDAAVKAVYRICDDAELREKMERNGLKTARDRDWSVVKDEVLKLYGE